MADLDATKKTINRIPTKPPHTTQFPETTHIIPHEPIIPDYLRELEHCTLCEWRCGVDRLAKERGVCMIGIPEVTTAMLHPANALKLPSTPRTVTGGGLAVTPPPRGDCHPSPRQLHPRGY